MGRFLERELADDPLPVMLGVADWVVATDPVGVIVAASLVVSDSDVAVASSEVLSVVDVELSDSSVVLGLDGEGDTEAEAGFEVGLGAGRLVD